MSRAMIARYFASDGRNCEKKNMDNITRKFHRCLCMPALHETVMQSVSLNNIIVQKHTFYLLLFCFLVFCSLIAL